jgi:TPR repeat protein
MAVVGLSLICGGPIAVLAQPLGQKQSDQKVFKEAQRLEETSGGDASAEFLLGDSYEHGRGTPQDYAEALRWYLKSANRDYPTAQVALAWLYFGHGPSNDQQLNMVEAYFWADVALASEKPVKAGGLSKDSREHALLLKKMAEGGLLHGPQSDSSVPGLLTPDKIASAQARATKWFAEHQ